MDVFPLQIFTLMSHTITFKLCSLECSPKAACRQEDEWVLGVVSRPEGDIAAGDQEEETRGW